MNPLRGEQGFAKVLWVGVPLCGLAKNRSPRSLEVKKENQLPISTNHSVGGSPKFLNE